MPNSCPTIAAEQQPHTVCFVAAGLAVHHLPFTTVCQQCRTLRMCRNAAEWSCPCKTKPVAVIVTRRVAVTVTRPVAVTVTIPVAVTVTRPVAVMQVQVHADEGCGLPVQAPQPVVLAHVTAAMRGATPQQVIVAIMKYRKFRSMLACITFFDHPQKRAISLFRNDFIKHIIQHGFYAASQTNRCHRREGKHTCNAVAS